MALIIRQLRKTYGRRTALDHVDLMLKPGVVALLGANGSGKSTLLRILATLLKPDSGEVTFNGWTYGRDERLLRQHIGYLPQDFELPDYLTPRKFLNYLADLRGAREQVGTLIDQMNLSRFVDQPVRKLSGGQLRLIGVAQAFLNSPPLLLLDELTHGLDLIERERVFQLIRHSGKLTIFSTHVAEEAENLANAVIVLRRGRVLFCGEVDELRQMAAGHVYEMTVPNEAVSQITTDYTVSNITPQNQNTIVRLIGAKPPPNSVPVSPSLTDSYLHILR